MIETPGDGQRRLVRDLMNMRGRAVMITGGAGHVGRTAAETFAELGADLVLLDRDAELIDAIAADLSRSFGVTVETHACDLEEPGAANDAIETITELTGRLDVLVNCAAFVGTSGLTGWIGQLDEQSVETWRRAIEVNLTAPFALSRAAAPMLRSSPTSGAIVNISSIYGSVGPDMSLYEGLDMGNPAAYAASKGGLEQLTRWLATTLAPTVRVNAIAPGGIERGQPVEFRERYSTRTPLRRMATEEDLKGALAYFGSDLSLYTTGQVLAVDGGWLAQ